MNPIISVVVPDKCTKVLRSRLPDAACCRARAWWIHRERLRNREQRASPNSAGAQVGGSLHAICSQNRQICDTEREISLVVSLWRGGKEGGTVGGGRTSGGDKR